jgi:enoyl-CoA hydratase/carnithine racemase
VNPLAPLRPVAVCLDEVTTLAAQGGLADQHGPFIVIAESLQGTVSVLDPNALGIEPCVVLGSDAIVASADELDLVTKNVGAATAAAVATCVLLRASFGAAVDTRFVLESATYSTLLAGDAFAQWQQSRSARTSSTHDPDAIDDFEGFDAAAVLTQRNEDELAITLNRGERGNSVNRSLRDGFVEALRLALADETIARVRLRGNGPHFCTGGDLNEFGTFVDTASAHQIRLQRSPARLLALLRDRGRKIVAELHGNCAGSGVELAAFATNVRAHTDTTFWLPELSLGLVPGAGGTISIVDRIGTQRTAWLLLTGRRITADVARAWGLIDEIIP